MILYHGSKEIVEFPELEQLVITRIFILGFIAHRCQSRQ